MPAAPGEDQRRAPANGERGGKLGDECGGEAFALDGRAAVNLLSCSRLDTDEFAQVYDDHIWDVYGYLGYRVRTTDQAEDLTQEVFERALRAWPRYDPDRASPRTWLLAIARNVVIDHYRTDRSGSERPLGEEPGEVSYERVGSTEDTPRLGPSPELEAALAVLTDRVREILALRFGGDLTGAEIADLTGLSLANVQQILSRSLRRLRAELEAAPASAKEPRS
jgi:RNA polymerase sigma factor (sigma-70 family)